MRKRGWNDEATEILNRRKRESGLWDRDDIRTMFDYIDADEGRPVRMEEGSGFDSGRPSRETSRLNFGLLLQAFISFSSLRRRLKHGR